MGCERRSGSRERAKHFYVGGHGPGFGLPPQLILRHALIPVHAEDSPGDQDGSRCGLLQLPLFYKPRMEAERQEQ